MRSELEKYFSDSIAEKEKRESDYRKSVLIQEGLYDLVDVEISEEEYDEDDSDDDDDDYDDDKYVKKIDGKIHYYARNVKVPYELTEEEYKRVLSIHLDKQENSSDNQVNNELNSNDEPNRNGSFASTLFIVIAVLYFICSFFVLVLIFVGIIPLLVGIGVIIGVVATGCLSLAASELFKNVNDIRYYVSEIKRNLRQ